MGAYKWRLLSSLLLTGASLLLYFETSKGESKLVMLSNVGTNTLHNFFSSMVALNHFFGKKETDGGEANQDETSQEIKISTCGNFIIISLGLSNAVAQGIATLTNTDGQLAKKILFGGVDFIGSGPISIYSLLSFYEFINKIQCKNVGLTTVLLKFLGLTFLAIPEMITGIGYTCNVGEAISSYPPVRWPAGIALTSGLLLLSLQMGMETWDDFIKYMGKIYKNCTNTNKQERKQFFIDMAVNLFFIMPLAVGSALGSGTTCQNLYDQSCPWQQNLNSSDSSLANKLLMLVDSSNIITGYTVGFNAAFTYLIFNKMRAALQSAIGKYNGLNGSPDLATSDITKKNEQTLKSDLTLSEESASVVINIKKETIKKPYSNGMARATLLGNPGQSANDEKNEKKSPEKPCSRRMMSCAIM
jgi:hypothetical protein